MLASQIDIHAAEDISACRPAPKEPKRPTSSIRGTAVNVLIANDGLFDRVGITLEEAERKMH